MKLNLLQSQNFACTSSVPFCKILCETSHHLWGCNQNFLFTEALTIKYYFFIFQRINLLLVRHLTHEMMGRGLLLVVIFDGIFHKIMKN